jgi:hypothetical protein
MWGRTGSIFGSSDNSGSLQNYGTLQVDESMQASNSDITQVGEGGLVANEVEDYDYIGGSLTQDYSVHIGGGANNDGGINGTGDGSASSGDIVTNITYFPEEVAALVDESISAMESITNSNLQLHTDADLIDADPKYDSVHETQVAESSTIVPLVALAVVAGIILIPKLMGKKK